MKGHIESERVEIGKPNHITQTHTGQFLAYFLLLLPTLHSNDDNGARFSFIFVVCVCVYLWCIVYISRRPFIVVDVVGVAADAAPG